jgi:hypothetical protein
VKIVAKRLVEHLERAGFVVMKRVPIIGGAAIRRDSSVDAVSVRIDGGIGLDGRVAPQSGSHLRSVCLPGSPVAGET